MLLAGRRIVLFSPPNAPALSLPRVLPGTGVAPPPLRRALLALIVCIPRAALLALVALVAVGCGGLPELPLDELPLSPVAGFVQRDPAITTSIRDARTEVPFLDRFDPSEAVSLVSLPRGSNNGFLLPGPGSYALSTRSYCLHAGTYGPTEGDGYIYAPLLGPRAPLIRRLAQNSVDHPEISQREVQTLIWSIQAHAKLYDTPREVQRTAAALLSEDDLRSLDDAAIDVLAGAAREQAYAHLPESARRVLRAENDLRRMLTRGQTTYEELERTAVLAGVPPREDDDRDVPRGRWSYHPDGFFVRYEPFGYSRTEVQLYVPEAVMFERDGAGRIVAVADFRGNRVEVEFEGDGPRQGHVHQDGPSAHPFQTLRFTRYTAMGSELGIEETDTLEAPGWTFVGPFPDEGEAPAQPRNLPGVDERLRESRDFQKDLRTLSTEAPNLGRMVQPGTPTHQDFVDLIHLDHGIRAAVESRGIQFGGASLAGSGASPAPSGPSSRGGASPDGGATPGGAAIDEEEGFAALDLVTKAWLHLLVMDPADGAETPGPGATLNPAALSHPAGIPGPAAGPGPSPPPPSSTGSWLDAWWSAPATDPFPQEEGVCDDLPGDSGGGEEFDPSDGTATPGSTGRQRLLPSAANADGDNADCGKAANLLDGLTQVRDAYANNPPRPGETGFDYGKRIEVDGFGYGKPGGATSPAQTELGSCVILGNKAYYASRPPFERAADCAHEGTHQAQCRRVRFNTTGGFQGWLMNPQNYRQAELEAYNAGIQTVEDWMAANCSGG